MGLLNNDWVQCTWRGTCFGQRIILTHHYLVVGDWGVATTVAQDLAQINSELDVAGAFDPTTDYLACLPPQYTLNEIRSQRIKANRSVYRSLAKVATVGTNANPATVASDAAAITCRGSNAGRSNLSVKKIGPVPDAASAAGLLTAPYTALLTALGSRLVQGFTPAGSGSLLTPIVPHADKVTFEILNNFLVGPESRVNRRRTVGLGI